MKNITGEKLYIDILDSNRKCILKKLSDSNLINNFHLAGGTALSLQLHLRESFDYDFFSSESFNEDTLFNRISEQFPGKVKVLQICNGTCDLMINNVQVSFFQYPYPEIADPVHSEDLAGLTLASVHDIAVMKFAAIGSRGSKKDFFDLYQVYHNIPGYNSMRLINDTKSKFGDSRDLSYMCLGLNYFDDADNEILPKCFVKYDWDKIKQFFRQEQKIIEQLI